MGAGRSARTLRLSRGDARLARARASEGRARRPGAHAAGAARPARAGRRLRPGGAAARVGAEARRGRGRHDRGWDRRGRAALAGRPRSGGDARVARLAGVRGGDARAGSRAPGRRRPDRGGRLVPRRVRRLAVGGLRAGRVGAPRDRSRRGPARAEVVRALVRTVDGVFEVDLDEEAVLGLADVEVEAEQVAVSLPLLVATAASGSTVIAVVDRRPPLVISNDAGSSWREAGGGLPPGRAVALAWDDPDYALYAARNRLYVSTNGGVFWRALALELPEIEAVALTA